MSNKEQSKDQLWALRHSTEHVLTQAMLKLYPDLKMAMGPATDEGFYFDFELNADLSGAKRGLAQTITPDDFPKIEAEMQKIIAADLAITKKEISVAEARELFKDNPYKLEWLDEIEARDEKPTVYWTGDEFVDLCAGPHVKTTGEIKAFKLMKIAGAYWHGDEKNKMLTRIYGTAYDSPNELAEYLKLLVEAEKRDHRKLGKELDLFIFSDLVGPGLPLYTFKGAIVRQEIINYSNELQKKIGYQAVHTPNMNKADLFKVSGHYEKFKDDMFVVKSHYSEEEYFLKPMNCPQHTQIYAASMKSYRDLPVRIADFAVLYRDEKPGELSGLTRLRAFCQDDAHCFCREDQIEQEFENVLMIIKEALTTYGLSYWVRLSLRDEQNKDKYLGDDAVWQKSQKILEDLLIKNKIEYKKAAGEAAFYGPKMDIVAADALKREFQISTIQLDFNMPNRFKLEYVDEKGEKKTPVMIHRAIVGSPERFMGILIEHYAGAFPLWLSPVQMVIISVGEDHIEHCQKLAAEFKSAEIRVEVWNENETVGNKIRRAVAQKIPYMLVIGDKEMNSEKLQIRKRGERETVEFDKEEFIEHIKELTQKKSAEL